LFKTHKNKKNNKFIVSERQYIGITATIMVLDQLWHLVRWARRAAQRKVLEHVVLGHRNHVVQRKSPPVVGFTSLPVASLLSPATAAASSPISMEAMSPSPPLGEGTGHQPSVILRQPGVPPKQRLLWMMALVARSIDMPFPPCVGGYGGIASCSRIH